VTFFGCDSVATTTSVIYDPYRIINSGVVGATSLKGSVNLQIPIVKETKYTKKDVMNTVLNGQASIPTGGNTASTTPDFDTCFACLLYAKGKALNNFMKNDATCSPCYAAYCWS